MEYDIVPAELLWLHLIQQSYQYRCTRPYYIQEIRFVVSTRNGETPRYVTVKKGRVCYWSCPSHPAFPHARGPVKEKKPKKEVDIDQLIADLDTSDEDEMEDPYRNDLVNEWSDSDSDWHEETPYSDDTKQLDERQEPGQRKSARNRSNPLLELPQAELNDRYGEEYDELEAPPEPEFYWWTEPLKDELAA